MKISNKIYIIVGSIVLLLFIYVIWTIYAFGGGLSGGPNRTMGGEIHLIPNNYIGRINIIFEQEDGLKKDYLRKKRLFKIPNSGILKTHFKPNLGWIRSNSVLEFYYVTDKGEIVKKLKSNFIRKEDSTFMRQNFNEIGIIAFGYFEQGDKSISIYSVDTLNSDLIGRKRYAQPMNISKEDLDKWND